MKKISLILICCLFFSIANAQVKYNSSGQSGKAKYEKNAEKEGFDSHKLIFGGGFGFGFGYGSLALSLSPIVGYRISERFSAGVRLGYQYNWIKDGQLYINGQTGAVEGENLNYHVFSPGAWARFIVWNNIFIHAEYEYNIFSYKEYQTSYTTPGYTSSRNWDQANSLILGIGLRQPMTSNASIVFMVGYDVLQNIPGNLRTNINGQQYSISPYSDRLCVRIGFNVGF